MAKVEISARFCKGCGLCVVNCPKECLSLADKVNERGVHLVIFADNGKCSGCCNCAVMCPDAAIAVG